MKTLRKHDECIVSYCVIMISLLGHECIMFYCVIMILSMCLVSLMDDSRLMSVEMKIDGITMTILNVYMPYDNGNNIEEYQSYLVKVDSKLSENHYACAMGDFNANVLSDTHRFGTELINYCDSERLVISDKNWLQQIHLLF